MGKKSVGKKGSQAATSPNAVVGRPFQKGNPGGPGNPLGPKVMALKMAMYDAVGTKDLDKLIRTHLRKAIAGDVDSARLILDRCFGKPKETVELKVGFVGILAEVKSMADAARLTEIDAPPMPLLPMQKVPTNGKRNRSVNGDHS